MRSFVAMVLGLPLLFGAQLTQAATLQWPGSGSCAGTLQACIDSALSGDIIEIATSVPIAGTVSFGQSLTLRPALGFSPTFASGANVSGSSSDPVFNVRVEGLKLSNARINLFYAGSGSATIVAHRNVLEGSAGASVQINFHLGGTGTADVQLSENRISATDGLLNSSLLRVTGENGTITGKVIHNNIVGAESSAGWAIFLEAKASTTMDLAVGFNEVRGRFSRGAIGLSEGLFSSGTTSSLTADIYNNVVVCDGQQGEGFSNTVTNGSIDARIVNNTVTQCSNGIGFNTWQGADGTGVNGGNLLNNLVAFNNRGIFVNPEFLSTVGNSYNLVHGNNSNQYTVGSNTITSDPMLLNPSYPWLRQGSPAIDAGNPFAPIIQALAGLASLDAAGLRRLKGSVVDIGAYEFGDRSLMHTATSGNIGAHVTDMAGAPFDFDSGANLAVTPNFNGVPGSTGPLFDDPLGVFMAGGSWRIFAQDLTPMLPDTKFNVFYPVTGNGVLTHISSIANISSWSTMISDTALDDRPDQFVLATQNWTAGGASVYNPHPIGVFYFAFGGPGSWFISNMDRVSGESIPADLGFNVYSQDLSPNAFRVMATAANTAGQVLTLDHPLLNATPCAQIQVTRISSSAPVAGHFDVGYAPTERWVIFDQDTSGMPLGSEYFVLVDARQIYECATPLFSDGFE